MNDAAIQPALRPELREALPGLEWLSVAPRRLPPLPAPGLRIKTLRRLLRAAKRPVVLVNDDDRVMYRYLPDVLADLWQDAPGTAQVVVATGTHKGGDPAAYRDRLGGVPLGLHDCDDAAAHGKLGDVALDRRVLEADLVVAIGSVEPHYFAGWTGAHKTTSIGVMARRSVERNHIHAMEPTSQPLALEGNPVHDGIARAVALLDRRTRLVCVNHVLDEEGSPLEAAVGTWRGSLERCLEAARARYVRDLPRPADLVVARVEGPLAKNLYQADKGIKNHEAVVKDGGDLVLEAPLPRGVGPDRFLRLLEQAPDLAAARAQVARDGYLLGDHKAVRWRALEARGVRIRIVSPQLDPGQVRAARLEVHPTLAAALEAIRAEGRGGAGLGVAVEDAGLVVTRVAP